MRTHLRGFIERLPDLCVEVGGDVFALGKLGPGDSVGRNAEGVEWWNGESEGNWLLGWVSHVVAVGDDRDAAAVDEYLNRIVAARSPDGYVGMFRVETLAERPAIAGDLWSLSRVLGALQLWAAHTRRDDLWQVVADALGTCRRRYQVAQQLGLAFAPSIGDSCGRGHDLMIVETIHRQVLERGDTDLVGFAEQVYRDYSTGDLDWSEADAQPANLIADRPLIGHGAHVAEHLRVPILLWELTGDDRYLLAFGRGVSKLDAALGATGALKSDETVGAPGSPTFAFAESGFEMCATTELLISLVEGARITGDMALLDRAELLFYNAFQGAVANDGRSLGYLISDNQVRGTRAQGERWDYSPTHDDQAVCCAPNAGRAVPAFIRGMASMSRGEIRIQLYGPGRFRCDLPDAEVDVTQVTDFPFSDSVTLMIAPRAPARFAVRLRVPGWCRDPRVEVRGVDDGRMTSDRIGAAIVVDAMWTPESVIELSLPSTPELRSRPDGRVFAAAGPLVFCQEIAARMTPSRHYEGSDYHDYDVTPIDERVMYAPALVGVATDVSRSAAGMADPWSNPPLTLGAEVVRLDPKIPALTGGGVQPITLVPFGSTMLRWTVFNRARPWSASNPGNGRPRDRADAGGLAGRTRS